MYKIYIKNYEGASSPRDEALFDSSDVQNSESDRTVLDPTVKNKLNKAGSFEFTVLPTNPFYGKIKIVKTIFSVYLDDILIFRGRVMTISDDIYRQRSVFCEGELAYLNDSLQPPKKEAQLGIHEYFAMMVSEHNSQMNLFGNSIANQLEDKKHFSVGEFDISGNGLSYRTTSDSGEVIITDENGNYGTSGVGIGSITVPRNYAAQFTWELNGINAAGENAADPLRMRTQNAVFVRTGSTVVPNTGYECCVVMYSAYSDAQTYTLVSGEDINTGALTGEPVTIDRDCYIRIVIRRLPVGEEAEQAFTQEELETVPDQALILSGLLIVSSVIHTEFSVSTPFNNTSYRSTFDALQNDLIDIYGGYVSVSYSNGVRYLNYTTNPMNDSDGQRIISFGVNLQEITKEVSAEDLYSVLLPTGDNNLLLTGAKSGKTISNTRDMYVLPAGGVREYGPIFKTQSFSGISKRSELQNYAGNYISKTWKGAVESYTLKAVDMHFVDPESPLILIGNRCRITLWPNNVIQNRVCTDATYVLQNPENNEYVFENLSQEREGLTSKYKKQSSSGRASNGVSNAATTSETGSGGEDMILRSNGNIILYPGADKFVSIPLAKQFLAPSLTHWTLGPVTYDGVKGFIADSNAEIGYNLRIKGALAVGSAVDMPAMGSAAVANMLFVGGGVRTSTLRIGVTSQDSDGAYRLYSGGEDGSPTLFHPVKLTMTGGTGEDGNPVVLTDMWVLGAQDVNFNIAESQWFLDQMDSAIGSVDSVVRSGTTNSSNIFNSSAWETTENSSLTLSDKYALFDVMSKDEPVFRTKLDASGVYNAGYSTALTSVVVRKGQTWTYDESLGNYGLQVEARWKINETDTERNGVDADTVMLPDIRTYLEGPTQYSDTWWKTSGTNANKYVVPAFYAKSYLSSDTNKENLLSYQNGSAIVIDPAKAIETVTVDTIEKNGEVYFSANKKTVFIPASATASNGNTKDDAVLSGDITLAYEYAQKQVAVGNPTWNEYTGNLPSYRTATFQTNVENTTAIAKQLPLYLRMDSAWSDDHKKNVYLSANIASSAAVAQLEVDASEVWTAGHLEGSGAGASAGFSDGYAVGQDNASARVEAINHSGGDIRPASATTDVFISISATSKLDLKRQNAIVDSLDGDPKTTWIDIPVDFTRPTLSKGDFDKDPNNQRTGKYVVKGTGGRVRIDYTSNSNGSVIAVNPTDLTININSNAYVGNFGWHAEDDPDENLRLKYTYDLTAFTKSDGETLFDLGQTGLRFDPSQAINYGKGKGFDICYNSVGLSAASQKLSPGEELVIYPKAKTSLDAASASNIGSGIKITVDPVEIPAVNVERVGSWVNGYMKFRPSSGTGSSEEVNLNIGTSLGTTMSTTINVLDGETPTGKSKILYLDCDSNNVYLKSDAGSPDPEKNIIAQKRNTGSTTTVVYGNITKIEQREKADYWEDTNEYVVYLKAEGTNIENATHDNPYTTEIYEIDASAAYNHGADSVYVTGADIVEDLVAYGGSSIIGPVDVTLSNGDSRRISNVDFTKAYQAGLEGRVIDSEQEYEFALSDGKGWTGVSYFDVDITPVYEQGVIDSSSTTLYIYTGKDWLYIDFLGLYNQGFSYGYIYANTPVTWTGETHPENANLYKIIFDGVTGYIDKKWLHTVPDSYEYFPGLRGWAGKNENDVDNLSVNWIYHSSYQQTFGVTISPVGSETVEMNSTYNPSYNSIPVENVDDIGKYLFYLKEGYYGSYEESDALPDEMMQKANITFVYRDGKEETITLEFNAYEVKADEATPVGGIAYIYNESGNPVNVFSGTDMDEIKHLYGRLYTNTPVRVVSYGYNNNGARYTVISYSQEGYGTITGVVYATDLIQSADSPSKYPGQIGWASFTGGQNYRYPAIIHSKNGAPINIRRTRQTGSSNVVTSVDSGSLIYCAEPVEGYDQEWMAVTYNGHTGYMQSRFIVGTARYDQGEATSGDINYQYYGTVISSPGAGIIYKLKSETGGTVAVVASNSKLYCRTDPSKAVHEDEWITVKTMNGTTGYIKAKYLKEFTGAPSSDIYPYTGTIKTGATVYKQPATSSAVVGSVNKGQTVKCGSNPAKATSGSTWISIMTTNGIEGYIQATYFNEYGSGGTTPSVTHELSFKSWTGFQTSSSGGKSVGTINKSSMSAMTYIFLTVTCGGKTMELYIVVNP